MQLSGAKDIDIVVHSVCSHGFQRIFVESSLIIENMTSKVLQFETENSKTIANPKLSERDDQSFRICIPSQSDQHVSLNIGDKKIATISTDERNKRTQSIMLENPLLHYDDWAIIQIEKENDFQRKISIRELTIECPPRYVVYNDSLVTLYITDACTNNHKNIALEPKMTIFYHPSNQERILYYPLNFPFGQALMLRLST